MSSALLPGADATLDRSGSVVRLLARELSANLAACSGGGGDAADHEMLWRCS